jgi:rhodanese-related sulfurtransferase
MLTIHVILDFIGKNIMADIIQEVIKNVKQALPNITPNPPSLKPESPAYDLKARLEWGEPALTIIDIRDRGTFDQGRITGAISMPMEQFMELAQANFEPARDIYIYGESDEQSLQAAQLLRGAGFSNVAQIMGGLPAWCEVAGPTEGVQEAGQLKSSAFNVVSRLKTEHELQNAGKSQQSKV